MNNQLQVFSYEGNEIRTEQRGDETLWVLKDVCGVLGIEKHRDAAARLDADERESVIVDTLGGPQEMVAVNESGLYSVILLSRKPEAKKFKRWVTHEVLPAIRKHSVYVTDELLADPDLLIRALQSLKEERLKTAALTAHNEDLTVRLNESERFWTIMKFNQHFNLRWDMPTCQRNGKAASAYSRQHGYEIRKCQTNDNRFKETNSYAYEVLETLFLPRRRTLNPGTL